MILINILADSTEAEESIRMVMKKLGIRPQLNRLSSSQKTRPRKKRPQTSIAICATIIAEQKTDSNSKALRTIWTRTKRG